LILAGAILSILINPLLFAALDWYLSRGQVAGGDAKQGAPDEGEPAREPIPVTHLRDHVVLVGHGRVGSVVSAGLKDSRMPLLLIESDEGIATKLKDAGVDVISGNAADPDVIRAANFAAAHCLIVAIPDAFEGGQVVEQARAINPGLPIIARAHSEEEIAHLEKHGASSVIMGEHEIAKAMLEAIGPYADSPGTQAHAGEFGTMATTTVDLAMFKDAMILLATAAIIVPLVKRWKVSPVLAFLLAGTILGPKGLGAIPGIPLLDWITVGDEKGLGIIGELGVVFLLFLIGLELSPARMLTMRRLVFGLGTLQVLVSTVLIALFAGQFGAKPGAAVIIGASLALSSTAIVVEVLSQQRRLTSATGRVSFAILLLQDLAVMP
ncbi:MAG: NAD-binding protein, partial [Solimonas sp.]